MRSANLVLEDPPAVEGPLEDRKAARVRPVARGASSAPVVRRVVHLIKHCGYGNGNVHVAVDLACVQAQQGCEVLFVSDGGTFEPMLAEHGVRHVKSLRGQSSAWALACSTWQLLRLCRSFRPDVLHAHMMGSALMGWVASHLTGAPLVTTVHNSFDKHSVLMRLGRRVVAVSHAEKRNLVAQGYKADKVDVVMNAPVGSPRETFYTNKQEPVVVSPCITAVCGLHRRKGVFDLIEAAATVFRESPDWRLYIAGEGPDREILEQQVREAGISAQVIFLGFVPAPRVLLEQSDIFVLASYADPCSLVIGEARGAGCAIVATAVGGTPEMLEFGEAGRLVTPGKPKELADALRILMQDTPARERLREVSLAGAGVFDVHRLIGEYDRVYQRARGGEA